MKCSGTLRPGCSSRAARARGQERMTLLSLLLAWAGARLGVDRPQIPYGRRHVLPMVDPRRRP